MAGAAIAAQTTPEDSAWRFTIPSEAFTDPDNETLTYGVRLAGGGALPAWLKFDAATRTLSGTPDNDAVSTLNLEIKIGRAHV